MESLLSLAFNNISSRNTNKTSKGLRQIEGLLAQICLSPRSNSSTARSKRNSSVHPSVDNNLSTSPQLQVLVEDLAFQEFFRLQESFEWNVATRLTECLERVLGMRSSPQVDELICSCLTLLQGALLLHPQSRTLFARESHMNLLLDLLDPTSVSPQILAATLSVLTTSLLDNPGNARVFETLDGINTVTSVWKYQHNESGMPTTSSNLVDTLCREFLAFYLMPESTIAPQAPSESPVNTAGMPPPSAFNAPPSHQRTPSKHSSISANTLDSTASAVSGISFTSNSSGGSDRSGSGHSSTRTAEEKRKLLCRYLDVDTQRAMSILSRTSWHQVAVYT